MYRSQGSLARPPASSTKRPFLDPQALTLSRIGFKVRNLSCCFCKVGVLLVTVLKRRALLYYVGSALGALIFGNFEWRGISRLGQDLLFQPQSPTVEPGAMLYCGCGVISRATLPAPPSYPLRYPKYHLVETIRP